MDNSELIGVSNNGLGIHWVEDADGSCHIVRAEAIWNFQPPVPSPPRPWWKLWSKEEREPEMPAIVADLRDAA